jgi:hypothetical protein
MSLVQWGRVLNHSVKNSNFAFQTWLQINEIIIIVKYIRC